MCEHEGRACPGKSCRCECMNCQFPPEVDDTSPRGEHDASRGSALDASDVDDVTDVAVLRQALRVAHMEIDDGERRYAELRRQLTNVRNVVELLTHALGAIAGASDNVEAHALRSIARLAATHGDNELRRLS